MNGTDEEIGCSAARPVQVKRVRKGGWTKAARTKFLRALAETCNVRMAAAACGMMNSSAYRLRKRDPEFAALWQEALGIGYERLENALLAHALTSLNAIEIGGDDTDDGADDDLDDGADEDTDNGADGADRDERGEPRRGAAGADRWSRARTAPVRNTAGAPERGPVRGFGNASTSLSPKILGASDVQVALAILNRHRASVEGRRTSSRTSRRRTQEEIDTLLRVQLDRLAKKLAASDALAAREAAARAAAAAADGNAGSDNDAGVARGDGADRNAG